MKINVKRVLFSLSFILFLFIFYLVFFLFTPIIKQHDFHYVLKPHTSAIQLAHDLHRHANLKYPFLFRLFIIARHDTKRLQAGEYLFLKGSTPNQILNQIIHGKVLYHTFTIINGRNYRETMKELSEEPAIQHTLSDLSPKEAAKKLELHYDTPDGWLFPDTYFYTRNTTDLALLNRAKEKMQTFLEEEWCKREKGLPYRTPYQALIVASMISKESSLEEEFPIIANIILKRWKLWIPLQIDPTIIFALGEKYKGKLTRKELKISSPYNTYLRYGLPPTPIAFPGAEAIRAALHPAKTNHLYFVSKGDGTHFFSITLKEHKKAIQRYHKRRK